MKGDGALPDHAPSPAPPKWLLVVKLVYVVRLASPRSLNSAAVTSAPNGIDRSPAVPFPLPENVWVYEVVPFWNWVSVVAPAAIGAIKEVRKIRVRKIAFRIKITGCPSMGLRPTAGKAFQLLPLPFQERIRYSAKPPISNPFFCIYSFCGARI